MKILLLLLVCVPVILIAEALFDVWVHPIDHRIMFTTFLVGMSIPTLIVLLIIIK